MTDQHPITPPPELVQRWRSQWIYNAPGDLDELGFIATRAAQWGADQELEACIAWLDKTIPGYELAADRLRATRRCTPSLKKQALKELAWVDKNLKVGFFDPIHTIRRVLEQLND